MDTQEGLQYASHINDYNLRMLQVDLVVSRGRNRPLVQPAGTLLAKPYRVRSIPFYL